jgi:hypothetical protein
MAAGSGGGGMKVWEKIAKFRDTKHWDKERIASECYMHKFCPTEIEDEWHFVGHKKHCESHSCDIECLNDYLDMEVGA